MKLLDRTVKLLAVFICVGLFAAAWITWERHVVETDDRTVEMVYNYDEILTSAPLEGKSVGELFALYRESGITSLAIYDDTPLKIMGRGDAKLFRGADFAVAHPREKISADCVYIQPSDKAAGGDFFKDFERNLLLRMRTEDVAVRTVGGVKTLEVRADWGKFLEMPVGIFPVRVAEAGKTGFFVVLRPLNPAHAERRDVDEFMKAVDASPQVSAVIFTGKTAFGYPDQLDYFREELAKRNVPIVLIEAQGQLGFEPQAGAVQLAEGSGYEAIRLYAMSKDELIKLAASEASARFYISDVERNIRMNLFPSYKYAIGGMTLSETNAAYIRGVTERLEGHGFTVGRASRLPAYFPDPALRSIVMVGALSIACLAFLFILPAARRFLWPLWGAGFLATQGIYWGTSSLWPLQLLALAVEIGMPVIVVSLFLDYCLAKKKEAEKEQGIVRTFLEGVGALWGMGILSLCGGVFVSGLLGDIRFFLEMEIFRGVKATFILPLLLVSLVYIQRFPFFGKPVTNDREFIAFVKKFCNFPIKFGVLCGLGFLAFAAFLFVGRSGNNMAPVPAFEVALRRFLEDHMYARPREKEFLFGHPAVFLVTGALAARWPQLLHYFLTLAVTIGQGSMVETFAHMRSPFILSFIRGLDGLAAGTGMGFLAVIAAALLLRLTKFFGERYRGNKT